MNTKRSKYSYEPLVHCADRSLTGDISFHLTLQPLVFLRLLTWGSLAPSPFSFAALRSRGFPHSKSQENYGSFPLNCSKKYPLPVNGYVGPRVHKNIYNLLLTQALVSCNRKTSFISPCPDKACSAICRQIRAGLYSP